MKPWMKAAAAVALGLGALGVTGASADDRDRGDRDGREHAQRDGERAQSERRANDRRDSDRQSSRQRSGDRRYDDRSGNRQSSDYRRSDERRADHRRDDGRRSDQRRADNRRYEEPRSDNRRYEERRSDNRRSDNRRYDSRRSDHRRYDDRRTDNRRYSGGHPAACSLDHDHRIHNRDYYSYYPKDRYYRADPTFAFSIVLGNGGYYDRGGRYYNSPYYDRRGYRDYGRIVNRETIRLRGYRADAVLIEEIYPGRRRSDLVCTVTARGPDARYVPYGQLRSIAARYCSHRADIRVYA